VRQEPSALPDQTILTCKGRPSKFRLTTAPLPFDPLRERHRRGAGISRCYSKAGSRAGGEEGSRGDRPAHSELLERTNAELQHFAYAVSHDLREPLRTITAFTQLVQLRSRSQLDQKSAECLQFIVAAAERMGQLIDALLDYSKAGEITEQTS
jgi:signal transduction histidine kinase